MTAGEILGVLNDIGEHERLEAKSLVTDNIRSLMETVCSFSNEPGLGGGVIILGVREEERPDGGKDYVVDGIDDLDHAQLQLDISTQCKGVFNRPVVPRLRPDKIKGSGFKRMERALRRVGLALPTAESDRVGNTFSLILLLHHLLNEDDLNWLEAFKGIRLTDKEKLGLVFVRQIGAIDNFSYRRQTGVETLKSCHDLQHLRNLGLLAQHGQGTRTYYRPGPEFLARTSGGLQVTDGGLQVSGGGLQVADGGLQVSGGGLQVSGAVDRLLDEQEIRARVERFKDNETVRAILDNVTRRMRKDIMRDVIWRLCSIRPLMRQELALLLGKNMNYIWGVLKGMKDDELLACSHPEMPNHPAQSYRAMGARYS